MYLLIIHAYKISGYIKPC